MTATQEREVVGRAMWCVVSCCDCSHCRSDELDDYDGRDGPVSMRRRFQNPIATAREGPREESNGGVEFVDIDGAPLKEGVVSEDTMISTMTKMEKRVN